MSQVRMEEIQMISGIPSNFIFRVPHSFDYVSILGPLEVTFRKKGFKISMHAFIKWFFRRYNLVLA